MKAVNERMNEKTKKKKEKENQKTKRIRIFHDQRIRVEPISFFFLLFIVSYAAAASVFSQKRN